MHNTVAENFGNRHLPVCDEHCCAGMRSFISVAFFTTNVAITNDHRVIDSGPYRFIRYPSYTGGLSAVLGLSLGFSELGVSSDYFCTKLYRSAVAHPHRGKGSPGRIRQTLPLPQLYATNPAPHPWIY